MKKIITGAVAMLAAGVAFAGGHSTADSALKKIIQIITVPAPAPTPAAKKNLPIISVPAAMPVVAGIASPSLQGLAKVSSSLSLQNYLQPSWGTGDIPGSMAPDDVGAFRFNCSPSHNAYNDPIVYPGQPGKSHLHTFFGNTLADANSTYASLRTTGDSTCNDILNRSAYWVPAMMNGAGKVVMPDVLAVYYKRYPATDPRCTTYATACLPLPRGLRYVFGYNMLDPTSTPTDTTKRWWNCDGAGATTGHFATIGDALKGCPVGDRIGAVLVAPDCWNGTQLDSPDHRSHMAYREQDGQGHAICPKTHPYIIPEFQLGVWYTTDASARNWYLASDRMSGMADSIPGSTAHADWFGAWDDGIVDLWTANCINKMLSCSGGDLGNGQQLKLLAGYNATTRTTLADIPARP